MREAGIGNSGSPTIAVWNKGRTLKLPKNEYLLFELIVKCKELLKLEVQKQHQ